MRMTILVACLWLATSPLWGKIVFRSSRDGNSEIYVMSSFGNGQMRLTDYDEDDVAPSWSPSGQQIVFGKVLFNRKGDRNEEVYVMDADGSNQRQLTHHPAYDGFPDWSPDGAQIAFVSDRHSRGEPNIYVMDADGGNVTQITHLKWAGSPMWSPDGRYIGFQASFDQQDQQVYVMDADGGNRWQVSDPLPNRVMSFEGWSPDGTQILYTGFLGGLVKDSIVIIATLDSRRRKAVKHEQVPKPSGMQTTGCAWGTDGKSVLISLRRAGEKWDIYRFNLPDGQLIQLTNHPAADYSPREWNSRLPVSPRGVVPKRWGEIKSYSHEYRGIGVYPISPVP